MAKETGEPIQNMPMDKIEIEAAGQLVKAEQRSLGVDVFSLFSTEIVRGILRPAYSAGVLWDILAMSTRNVTHASRRASTMVPPDRASCLSSLISTLCIHPG